MALYIPQSILHLARSLYVRPETYGPTYVFLLFPIRATCLGHLIFIESINRKTFSERYRSLTPYYVFFFSFPCYLSLMLIYTPKNHSATYLHPYMCRACLDTVSSIVVLLSPVHYPMSTKRNMRI